MQVIHPSVVFSTDFKCITPSAENVDIDHGNITKAFQHGNLTDMRESTSVFQIRIINWINSINDKSPLIGLFKM